jgi:alpha-tubulin suppressor-like RCC1 family protein
MITDGGEGGCALTTQGTVWAWDDNSFGQLGDGRFGSSTYSDKPLQVPGLTSVTAISSGSGDVYAIVR